MKKEEKIDRLEQQFKKRLIVIGVVAILFIVGFWCWNYTTNLSGTFGDKFGVINALFSGLAFAGIIITIYMQKHELELQRKELEETREVFKKQSGIMHSQKVESTFFHLLDNHRKFVDSLAQSHTQKIRTGKRLALKTQAEVTNKISGYEVLDEVLSEPMIYLNNFHDLLYDNVSYDPSFLNQPPTEIIEGILHIRQLWEEVDHIMTFITANFKNEEEQFYFDTLERSLSVSERHLLGLYNINIEYSEQLNYLFEVNRLSNYYDFNKFSHIPEIEILGISKKGRENKLRFTSSYSPNVRLYAMNSGEILNHWDAIVLHENNEIVIDFEGEFESNGFACGDKWFKRFNGFVMVLEINFDYANASKRLFAQLDVNKRGNSNSEFDKNEFFRVERLNAIHPDSEMLQTIFALDKQN